MSTIQSLFQQAQLAEAAYAKFVDGSGALLTNPEDIKLALRTGDSSFSPIQASDFVTHWSVVDQYNNSALVGLIGSGFSATVFQNKDTGQYSFAIRGSLDVADFTADTKLIATDGIAVEQVVDMYNYWQRLTHLGVYQAATLTQVDWASNFLGKLYAGAYANIPSELLSLLTGLDVPNVYDAARSVFMKNGYIVEGGKVYSLAMEVSTNVFTDSRQWGSNVLAGKSVSVDGHSLGGHLAMAFSRLFPAATADATAVNGLGFKVADTNVNNLFAQLIGAPGFDAGKIENVYGIAGNEFAAMNNGVLQQPGGWDGIEIESWGLGVSGGHAAPQMTDCLALYNLFATLDPSLDVASAASISKITDILKASSNLPTRSLETTLDAIGKIFGKNFTTTTDDRESLYANLQQVQSLFSPAFSVSYTVASLTGIDAATLAANAQGDIAYRYALLNANPFAIVGADYGSFNQNGELDLYDAATGKGSLSTQYLEDRAHYVSELVARNMADTIAIPLNSAHGGNTEFFLDYSSGIILSTVSAPLQSGTAEPAANVARIVFGSDKRNSLQGADAADHLYGMGGDDKLTGGKGNDYLEGGAGDDIYIIKAGDGTDTIEDEQGVNKVIMNGAVLSVFNVQANGGYLSADGGFSAEVQGTSLLVTSMATGDQVSLNKNFQEGDFGIHFNIAGTPSTTLTLTGDSNLLTYGTDANGNPVYHYDSLGNRLTDGTTVSVDDILHGSTGNDHILGITGRDFLEGRAGDDLIEGGSYADILAGGTGNDLIYGDVQIAADQAIALGNDSADPMAGTGQLPGNQTSDWLAGNGGDDTLVAGASNDVVSGGGGNDLLIAGAGNDYILGDSDYTATDTAGNPYFDWTVTPHNGAGYTTFTAVGEQNPADSGNDIVYAGSGDDVLWANAGDDVAYGQNGNDFLVGNAGADILVGEAGNDQLYGDNGDHLGAQGNDYLDGGDGSDTLSGEGGDDTLLGGSGDDTLDGGTGSNFADGGDGNDTLYVNGAGDTALGGAGNDQFVADAGGSNTLDGGEGDDSVDTYGSHDVLLGGAGNDTLNGGAAGSNYLDGGDGTDLLVAEGGNNSFMGGMGNDTISANITGGNSLDGGDGIDTLVAEGGNNTLTGGAGDDTLSANVTGTNSLDGGDGNDLLIGEGGNNTLYGGMGDDRFSAAGGNSYLDGGDGADNFTADGGGNIEMGGAGNDILVAYGTGNMLDGGSGDDSLNSWGSNSALSGGDGNDSLFGADAGGDTLDGGAGDDVLQGGVSTDTLQGGSGNDLLIGGDGNDIYVYHLGDGVDHIVDSSAGGQINILRFGSGISTSSIVLRLGSLMVDMGNGDAVHIDNFDPNDVTNSCGIQRFEFFDGSAYSAQELVTLLGITASTAGRIINGTGGDDTLYSGKGDDTLNGGAGSDTYVYNMGDGNDTISDSGGYYWDAALTQYVFIGNNTLSLGTGIDAAAIATRFDASTNQVALDIAAGGSINIGSTADIAVQTVQFADGTSQTISEFLAQHPLGVAGTPAPESINGTQYSDVIQGGAGNDVLEGQSGSDTYIYNLGDGADTIFDKSADGQNNVLSFGAGITQDMLKVRHVGDDLVLDLGNSDSIVVGKNIISNGNNAFAYFVAKDSTVPLPANFDIDPFTAISIQTLQFQDGTTLNLQNFILQHGMDKTGTGGADTLMGESLFNATTPASIADRLEGGKGNDTLFGGSGDDIYVFNRGDGADTLVDATTPRWDIPLQRGLQGGNNILSFGAGITANDITATFRHNSSNFTPDAVVLDLGNGDSINIGTQSDNLAISTLQFSDGSTIAINDFLLQRGLAHVSQTSIWGEYWNGVYNYPNIMRGLGGNDVLKGRAYDDLIEGGIGNDNLFGDLGSDTYVYGTGNGTDWITDDFIGNNVLSLGAGIAAAGITPTWDAISKSLLLSFGGSDKIYIGSLDDPAIRTLRFSDGTSMELRDLLVQSGVVRQIGTSANDLMATFADGQPLLGDAGDDQLYGSTLVDTLAGGAGNDVLIANAGNDVLDGGTGNDTLDGGKGSDSYIYNLGDGADVLTEQGNIWSGELNTLTFGAGITAGMMVPVFNATTGELTLELGAGAGSIDIGNAGDAAVQRLQFADGTGTGLGDFINGMGGLVQVGSAGVDFLSGTRFLDRLSGLEGDDELSSYEGDDILNGGIGNDSLAGGLGNDTYFFNLGDGADVIYDSSYGAWANEGIPLNEINTLVFGPGITPLMVMHTVNGSGQVVLDIGGGDTVNIGPENDLAIQRIRFTGGAEYAIADVLSGNLPVEQIIPTPIPGQITHQGDAFNFILPADAFTDTTGNTLTFSVVQADGSALPAWLSFDPVTQIFTGVPSNWDVATLSLSVTAASSGGLSATSGFVLDVLNVNDAPTANGTLPGQSVIAGQTFALAVPPATFDDVDFIHGDSLSYRAEMADGSPLPAWLLFDAVNVSLSGAVPTGSAALFNINILATDIAGAIAAAPFSLNVTQPVINSGGDGQDTHDDEDSHQGSTEHGTFKGGEKNDKLSGSSGADELCRGRGNDTYIVNDRSDKVTENLDEGSDMVQSMVDWELGENLEKLALLGASSLCGSGNELDNILSGNKGSNCLSGMEGDDTLNGMSGNDMLQGGSGDDWLTDTSGTNLMDGGSGMDKLSGGSDDALFIGGAGDDIIATGSGADIIAFNRGDGQDTVIASAGADNTISLGGINYHDLTMRKSGKDLILDTGFTSDTGQAHDQIRLQNWFSGRSNRSVANLQIVLDATAYDSNSTDPLLNHQIQSFDFALLAQNFDQALAGNPTLTSWSMTDALLSAHLSGSDTAALGGDLAYQYNLNGTLAGIGVTVAQEELGNASFGVAPQLLQPLASLQTGVARLN